MKATIQEELYDGKIRFGYDDGLHKYVKSNRVSGDTYSVPTPVLGITTVTGIIDKPGLKIWASGLAADYAARNPDKLPMTALIQEAKNRHIVESRKGASTGTVGHTLIEALLLGKQVSMPTDPIRFAQASAMRTAFEQFVKDYQPTHMLCDDGSHLIERPMYSLEHDYAGTPDYPCVIGGKNVVLDWKSTNRSRYNPDGIYGENFAQLGGQIILIEEEFGIKVDDAGIVNVPKVEGETYVMRRLSDIGLTTTDAKLYFLNCLGLYRMKQTFDFKLGG